MMYSMHFVVEMLGIPYKYYYTVLPGAARDVYGHKRKGHVV